MLKLFVKGVILGCGFLLPLAIISGVTFAIQLPQVPQVNNSLGSYDITPQGYKFTWLEMNEACQDMSTRLGVQVNKIQDGAVIIGYQNDNFHTPIIKKGIVITFDKLPTSVITDSLDYDLSSKGLIRFGGKTITDAVKALEFKVTAIEAKVGK